MSSVPPPSGPPYTCAVCNAVFTLPGPRATHQAACTRKAQERTERHEIMEASKLARAGPPPQHHPRPQRFWDNLPPPPLPFQISAAANSSPATPNSAPPPISASNDPSRSAPHRRRDTSQSRSTPELHSVRTSFHPYSRRPVVVSTIDEYRAETRAQMNSTIRGNVPTGPSLHSSNAPWYPFRTRTDFEFANLTLNANMSRKNILTLMQLIQRCSQQEDSLTFSNFKNLEDTWSSAEHMATPWQHETFSEEYNGEKFEFTVRYKSLMDWILGLVKNPDLADVWQWDAVSQEIFDGEEWQSFVTEPYTAGDFYNIQTCLPPGSTPLGIILYADKTQLSNFSGIEGHPVYARIANLPSHIRNGNGVGGGQVVGWLPKVHAADIPNKGKPHTWADLKHVVWHKSFEVILRSIKGPSNRGLAVQCPDGIIRKLFPFILILSADYEEQALLAGIRGVRGQKPCPVCTVDNNEQCTYKPRWVRRSGKQNLELVNRAMLEMKTPRPRTKKHKKAVAHIESDSEDVSDASPEDMVSDEEELPKSGDGDALESDSASASGESDDGSDSASERDVDDEVGDLGIETTDNDAETSGVDADGSKETNMDDVEGIFEDDQDPDSPAASPDVNPDAYGRSRLDAHALRPVQNAFMSISLSDPHRALTFDRLHNYPGGLAKTHLVKAIQEYLEGTSKERQERLNNAASKFPTWPSLIRYKDVTSAAKYQDSNHWEDLARVLLYLLPDVIQRGEDELAALLTCLRLYNNLNVYSSFELHTPDRITEIRRHLKQFTAAITTLAEINSSKSWAFPKMHVQMHLPNDIISKGATKHATTKPFEFMHKALKRYFSQTNGKNTDDQILKKDTRENARLLIKARLDAFDKQQREMKKKIRGGTRQSSQQGFERHFGRITLGSQQGTTKPPLLSDVNLQSLLDQHSFASVKVTASTFMKGLKSFYQGQALEWGLPDFKDVRFQEYRNLLVSFASKETFLEEENYLRCTPKFHHRPRYDCVLVENDSGLLFARLLMLFTLSSSTEGSKTTPMAMILPYDGVVTTAQRTKDWKSSQQYRVCLRPRPAAEFIFAQSIVRGALLVPSLNQRDNFYVFDVLDGDMFLRIREVMCT